MIRKFASVLLYAFVILNELSSHELLLFINENQ